MRNSKVDLLRSLAILLVILAHASPPNWLMQVRTFDVVLLFLLAGGGISLSRKSNLTHSKTTESNISAFLRRGRKLILPAYGVTVGYWLTVELACLALRRDFAYSLPQLLYALGFTMRGLGFIWVAIIFFWGTLLGPFFLQLSACIRSNLAFAGLLAGGFALNQLLWQLNQRLATADAPLWLQLLLNDYLNQWLAYLLVILAGVRLLEEKNFKYHLLALGVIALMLGQCWLGCGFCPNNYKYPPHLYYLGYGLSVAMLLWGLFTPSIHMRWLEWFSRHSWDIYLVHILFYVGTVFLHHWMARYVVVLAGSIVTIILLEAVKAKLRYANRTPMAYKVGPG